MKSNATPPSGEPEKRMKTIKQMESRLEEIDTEISDLKGEQYEIEDKIDRLRGYEKLEPVVLAALNRNYNKWCNRAYLEKHIRWDETEYQDADELERTYRAVAACDVLFEKGIIQRKEVGRDWENDPIFDYRITDTETPDMFGRN